MADPTGPQGVGDPLLQRLERLGQRARTNTSGGGGFPPPVPGTRLADGPAPAPRPAARPVTRRRHPARGARACALVASCAATGGLAYLFANDQPSAAQSTPVVPTPVTTTPTPAVRTGTANTSSAAPPTAPADPPPATAPTTNGGVTAFEGDAVSTRYGPVQVQAQVQDGKLVAVAVEQYPDSDRRSERINAGALPLLQSEALAAQSATVDTVSGATYTSDGYSTSLQSALDRARANGALPA
jgi:uncharacterized protein with FMN-binding domain